MAFMNDTHTPSGHPLFQLADALRGRSLRRRSKSGLRGMLQLDDHLLRDIGVTRDQVKRAIETPSSRDAADELRRMSLSRPGPWM